ncbi:MAG TPA: hypothetical protein VN776_09605 [Terracidiphilus sp.]|nr:hypothetical protein [Terracidiphilus sp.]
MLQGMQQPSPSAPSAASATFAGLLASLATPAPTRKPAWNDDDLEDDVATLSYDRALRAHARYKAPEPNDRPLTQPQDPGSARRFEEPPAEAGLAAKPAAPQGAAPSSADAEPEAAHDTATAQDWNLKCASITIRLTKAECDQLRKRAAEAGLTVSAYMRSCTFEAERLRALVKDTLAQLRTEPGKAETAEAGGERRSWRQRLARLLPHRRDGEAAAQA